MECLWVVIVIFCSDKVTADTDPCSTYQNVSDTDLQNDFSNKMCFPNSPVPIWYRFTSNAAGTMHTDCKSASTCGGSGQVWIDGTLPIYNAGTTHVPICIKLGSCCNQRNTIAVRNCNSFFVFELRRLPKCDIRYCFNKNDTPLVTVATRTTTTSTTSTTESTSTSYTTVRTSTTSTSVATSISYKTTRQSTTSQTFSTSTSYKTTRKPTTSISTTKSTASTSVAISKPTSTLTTSTLITLLTTTSTKASTSSRMSSKSLSSIIPTTIPSYSMTPDTQGKSSGTQMILNTTRSGYLDKIPATTSSTNTRFKKKTKDADDTALVIAICGSFGALLFVAVIFIVIFRVYRSKLQQILPDEHQSLPKCHDMARNVKFNAGHLQSRPYISP